MVVVHAVRTESCPSCAADPGSPCDRCGGSGVVPVLDPPKSAAQVIAEKLREIRARCGG